uniref:Uncharacterized protein n=1 Tax=Rhizophora mucronata TaxID=61149 RepID=A0A2P2QDT1_RHIMU
MHLQVKISNYQLLRIKHDLEYPKSSIDLFIFSFSKPHCYLIRTWSKYMIIQSSEHTKPT